MNADNIAALQAEAAGAMAAAAAAQAAAAAGGMPGPFGGGFVPPPVAMSFFHVLTVPDAAQFLRVSESVVIAEAEAGRLPGRKLGNEWRFLEFALAEWLRTGQQSLPEAKPKSSKERMLAIAGLWKDDPTVDAMVEEIYRQRKANPVGGK
ncbi:MAG: helix-turn-helix domain-containing protein [Planctomycetia bacterium]|nr:helix-turn-helix domain-containing protein [Planctomycetia bacterium]